MELLQARNKFCSLLLRNYNNNPFHTKSTSFASLIKNFKLSRAQITFDFLAIPNPHKQINFHMLDIFWDSLYKIG